MDWFYSAKILGNNQINSNKLLAQPYIIKKEITDDYLQILTNNYKSPGTMIVIKWQI